MTHGRFSEVTRQSILIGLGATLLLLLALWQDGFLWLSLTVSAAPVIPPGTETTIADIVGKVILGLNVLTWILFTFLNYLLDPLFIFGVGGNLMALLNEIWRLARDLMNLVFAIMLIGTAIYTILTAKKEFLSQYGPKFIVAVILVNFSWFLPRVVIDVANVGAAAVYGIPSLLNNNPAAQCWVTREVPPPPPPAAACVPTGVPNRVKCPCTGVVDVQFFVTEARRTELENNVNNYKCPLGTVLCYKEEILNFAVVAPFSGVLNGLIVNHARLATLATIPSPPPVAPGGDVTRMLTFLLRQMIILVIHIALFFPLLAMTIAFFIRIPVLWITIAFMPFYFLDFLLAGAGEQFTQGYGKKILSTFLKAAFLPMLVAVPLSIGLMLLNAGSQLTGGEIAGIPIRLLDQVGNFWQLLWLFMALAVLWVGVFAILKGDDILSTGAASIKGYGESLGRIALKAPLAAPVIPATPGSPGLSVLGALRLPQALESHISSGRPLDKSTLATLLGRATSPPEAVKAAKSINSDPSVLNALRNAATSAHNNATSLEQIRKILSDRGYATDLNNIHINIAHVQRAGVKLDLSEARIAQIEAFAKKEAAAAAAKSKKVI